MQQPLSFTALEDAVAGRLPSPPIEDTIAEVSGVLRDLRRSNRREFRFDTMPPFPRKDHVRVAVDNIVRALFPRRLGSQVVTPDNEERFVTVQLSQGLKNLSSEIAAETAYWQAQSTS